MNFQMSDSFIVQKARIDRGDFDDGDPKKLDAFSRENELLFRNGHLTMDEKMQLILLIEKRLESPENPAQS